MGDNILKVLQDHCVGTAESEATFLKDVFVASGKYADLLNSAPGSPQLLLGRKGTGKSAFLKYIEAKGEAAGITVVYIQPDDLLCPSILPSGEDVATWKRYYGEALINTVAVREGQKIRGLLGKSDKKLFDKAIEHGYRGHDFIQAAARNLFKIGTAITDVNFSELLPGDEMATVEELRRAIKTKFERAGEKTLFLLIDDIDQVAPPGQQINRVWAFLLACRKFAADIPTVKCFISLRTEIWAQLRLDKQGQRDQVDHFEPLVQRLDPTDEEIKEIIDKRLKYVADKGKKLGDPYLVFFESHSVDLPSTAGMEQRSWGDYLSKSARSRPRDAIQFLGIHSKLSLAKGCNKICNAIVEDAAQKYSAERVEHLTREYGQDCNCCSEIIREFASIEFEVDVEEVRKLLLSIPSKMNIILRSKTIHPDDDIFTLWAFLHEIGFINPRIDDARQPKGYAHIRFEEDPCFVSKANWNHMQAVRWEIHPAYRSFLRSLKERDAARVGLFPWIPKKNKR